MSMQWRHVRSAWIVAAVFSLSAPAAMADIYVTGSGGIATHEFANVDNASAYTVGIGATGPARRFALEFDYVNLGSAYISSFPTGNLSMAGYTVSAIYQMPIRPLVYGFRLGFYNMNASDSGTALSANSVGVSWGVTLGYEPNGNIMFYWDTQGFGNVDPSSGQLETPTMITLGARFYLGGR